MSKIGEQPVKVSQGVEVEYTEHIITVKGPAGELKLDIPPQIMLERKGEEIVVICKSQAKKARALHGLIRSILYNAVQGVVKPHEKIMKVVGTGYRVKKEENDLRFDVGYSHPVIFKETDGVEYEVKGKNIVIVKGINKQRVGEVAYKIRMIRKPDPYKGKGIQYDGEVIKLKPGKKAKTE